MKGTVVVGAVVKVVVKVVATVPVLNVHYCSGWLTAPQWQSLREMEA
jgi:hypothetical protein